MDSCAVSVPQANFTRFVICVTPSLLSMTAVYQESVRLGQVDTLIIFVTNLYLLNLINRSSLFRFNE